jgi:biotin transport system substrate-specific component
MYGDPGRTLLLSQTSAFIVLITVGGWLSIPFPPVPITLQSFFVLLAGAVMGRRGVIPVLLYLLLGVFQMPVFHNGLSGIGILLGPTGGYLIGFVPAALIIGLCYEKKSLVLRIAGIAAATLVIYAFGISWLLLSTGIPFPYALAVGMLLFLPGDILKGILVYLTGRRIG